MRLLAAMRASLRARSQQESREDELAFLLSLQERSGRNLLMNGASRDAAVQAALALSRCLSDCGRKLASPDLERREAFLRLVETSSTIRARHKTGYVAWVRRLGAGLVGLSMLGAAVASAGAELGVGNFELPNLGLPSVDVSPEPEDGQGADLAPVESIAPVGTEVSMLPAETYETIDVVFDLLLGGDESGPIAEDLPQAATQEPEGDVDSPVLASVTPDAAPSLAAPAGEFEPVESHGEETTETPQPQPVTALSWFPGQGRSSGPSENASASPYGPQVHSQSHAGEPPRSASAHGAQGLPQAHANSQGHSGLSDDVSLQQGPRLDSPQEDTGSPPPGRATAGRARHDRGENAEDDEAALTA